MVKEETMLRLLIVLSVAAYTLAFPLKAERLEAQGRTETLAHREFAHQPMPRYQAGFVYSVDGSHSAVRIDSVNALVKRSMDRAIRIPDSFQVMVQDVAVSFDGDIAVSADATDRDGRLVSLLAWLDDDGEPVRIVRTSPFAATDIGYTADGSLWAAGIVKVDRNTAHSTHDIVRRYSPDGVLTRSLLPRSDFSSDIWHPAYDSFLVTSRNYVAFISREAATWTLMSAAGVVVGHGSLEHSSLAEIFSGCVTDSGRIFLSGHRSDDQTFTVFAAGGSVPTFMDVSHVLDRVGGGYLAGSDGEDLVLFSGRNSEFIWLRVN